MKNIQPINEEAVRKAREETNAATPRPKLDVSKIYQAPTRMGNGGTIAPPQQPAVGAGTPGTPPTPGAQRPAVGQPQSTSVEKTAGAKDRVAVREPALKLFALVLLLFTTLQFCYYAWSFISAIHQYHIPLTSPASKAIGWAIFSYYWPIILVPWAASVYLLISKSVIAVRAVLILLSVGYAIEAGRFIYQLIDASVTYGTQYHPDVGAYMVTIIPMVIAAVWAWTTNANVKYLED